MKGFHVSFRFFFVSCCRYLLCYPPFLMANKVEEFMLPPFSFQSSQVARHKLHPNQKCNCEKKTCFFWCFSQFQTNFTVFRGFSIFKLPHERSKNHPKTRHFHLPRPRPKLLKRAVKELKIRSWSFCLKQMVETPPGSIQLSRFK